MSRPGRTSLWALAAVVLGGCGDAGPTPGVLSGSLVSPNGPEGAALLTMVGSGIGEVEAPAEHLFQFARGDTLRMLVVLESPGDVTFTVPVPDVNEPPAATVVQVAAGDDGLRTDLTGYRVRLRR